MEIKQKNTAELLELTVDNKLTFEKRIKKPFRSAGNQLNALFRLKLSKNFFKKFDRSFVYSNFNLCPLVWHFWKTKVLQKIENIQKRALRNLHDESASDCRGVLRALSNI